ncbi:MAG TPA: ribosome maturation factor RimM [Acidobacteriota bacterium]|nr:ribosome maturation factor RimM [Acidobacteriota bacterium]
MDQFVSIARIIKTRGIRGEVAAEILSDFPERFSSLSRVYLSSGSQGKWEVLEQHWFHGQRVIFKFEGRNRPHEVEDLIGYEVQVPLSERVGLPEDSFFDSDLIGCRVFEDEKVLGTVTSVLKVSETATLVVLAADDTEFMIPLVKQFIREVSIDSKAVHVQLPSGMVDLGVRTKYRRPEGA